MNTVDPLIFGLSKNTVVEQDGSYFYIVINRKSRIIMKDSENILDKCQKIKNVYPDCNVKVKTAAPVCSKTRTFLNSKGVEI